MEGKASMIVMSHLSDAQECVNTYPNEVHLHINFVKFIILKLNGNLNQEIDPDVYWDAFQKQTSK